MLYTDPDNTIRITRGDDVYENFKIYSDCPEHPESP